MSEEYNYWPTEFLQSTESLKSDENIEFIEEKIRELDDNISFVVDDYIDWNTTFNDHKQRDCGEQKAKDLFQFCEYNTTTTTTTTAFSKDNVSDFTVQLEKYVRNYVMHCIHDFRKSIDTKIKLAKAQVGHS